MAASAKPLLLLFLVMLSILGEITCNLSPSSSSGNDEALENRESSSSRSQQLDVLKSRISALESIIKERTGELISKEETIRNMEMIIQENSDTISMLQSEIDFIQSASLKKHEGKAEEQVYQLEKQICKLKREVELLKKRKHESETRAAIAEKRVAELGSKLESLLKMDFEQKQRIQDTEYSLKEQLQKVESDAAPTYKEFIKINGELLLYKLDLYLSRAEAYVGTQWNELLRPTMYATARKVYEKKDQLKKWSEPHIEALNSKWIPAINDAWLTFTTSLEPKIHSLTNKSIEVYQSSKRSLTPYLIQALNVTGNYIQIAKMQSQPYFARVLTVAKPHLDRAHVVLKPYTKNIQSACTRFANSARTYHQQAQELLKNNELTKPVASVDLAWFVATALLSFPLIFIIKLLSAISNTKPKRDSHKRHAFNGHRRAKRGRY